MSKGRYSLTLLSLSSLICHPSLTDSDQKLKPTKFRSQIYSARSSIRSSTPLSTEPNTMATFLKAIKRSLRAMLSARSLQWTSAMVSARLLRRELLASYHHDLLLILVSLLYGWGLAWVFVGFGCCVWFGISLWVGFFLFEMVVVVFCLGALLMMGLGLRRVAFWWNERCVCYLGAVYFLFMWTILCGYEFKLGLFSAWMLSVFEFAGCPLRSA